MEIKILKDILGANEQIAQKNHELLVSNKIFAVNIMASPGAGKTSVVIQTILALKDRLELVSSKGTLPPVSMRKK
jgi:hydrogenase nickel incorporation protein HypB